MPVLPMFVFVHLLVAVLLLRFWLQLIAANYYNPVSQAIAKALAPIVNPLQKIVPVVGRFNLAVLLLAIAVNALAGYFFVFTYIPWWQLFVWSLLQTVSTFLYLCFWLLVASVISSWLAGNKPSPYIMLVQEAVAPLIEPIRRLLPSVAGLDFSPIVLFLGIQFFRQYVLLSLYQFAGVPVV